MCTKYQQSQVLVGSYKVYTRGHKVYGGVCEVYVRGYSSRVRYYMSMMKS